MSVEYLATSWFCPYCCATVDTACVTSRGTGSGTRTPVRLARPLGYSRSPLSFGDVSGCNHKETQTGYKHLIKNSAVYLVLSFSWFHNTAVERQPAGGSGLGRRKSCGLPLGRDLLRELPLRDGMPLPHFRVHDPSRRRALASGTDLSSTVWAFTALGMYILAHRQERPDLKRPDDVARQSR